MSSCLRLPHIAMVSLFWSLLIILLINLYNYQTFFKIELFSNQANKSVPFISILILAPITCIVALYNLLKGYKANICRDCYARHGAQGYYEYLAGHTAGMELNAYATRDIGEEV